LPFSSLSSQPLPPFLPFLFLPSLDDEDDDAAVRFTNLWLHTISQATVALFLRAVLAGLPRLSSKGVRQVGWAEVQGEKREGGREGGMEERKALGRRSSYVFFFNESHRQPMCLSSFSSFHFFLSLLLSLAQLQTDARYLLTVFDNLALPPHPLLTHLHAAAGWTEEELREHVEGGRERRVGTMQRKMEKRMADLRGILVTFRG